MADIPGIIEGAAEGAGLGHAFCATSKDAVCLFILWTFRAARDATPLKISKIINSELKRFSEKLAECPQVVVGNKTDLCDG